MIHRTLVVILLLGALPACQQDREACGFQHPVFKAARRNIFALGGQEAGVQGTAFVLRHGSERYLIASFHVVSKLEKPFVQNDQGDLLQDLTVLAADRRNDVVVLCAPEVRRQLRTLLDQMFPQATAISYGEIPSGMTVEAVATV